MIIKRVESGSSCFVQFLEVEDKVRARERLMFYCALGD